MKNITGIILAGGKSSRMGRNKALLRIHGQTVIEGIVDKLKQVCDEVYLVTNQPDIYKFLNLPMYTDESPFDGPPQAVRLGLSKAKNDRVLVVSCDLPLLRVETLHKLVQASSDVDAVVPLEKERLHPLCALYKKSAVQAFEATLKEEKRSMIRVLNKLDCNYLNWENAEELLNLNTPQDFEKLEAYFQQKEGIHQK